MLHRRVAFITSQTSKRGSLLVARSASRVAKRLQYAKRTSEPKLFSVSPDGSDAWRLDAVVELLRDGAVGVIPTDTLPAIVCDVHNRDAVLRLYTIKEMDAKKPLSLLCNSFTCISTYTTGFPTSNTPGEPNWFNIARRILPGPYTFVLPATKNLPSQCIDFMSGKNIHRKSVGVRLPADAVCQAVLEGLGGPLLCTSVHVPDVLEDEREGHTEIPDVGSILEMYGSKGLDFVVDVGRRVVVESSVVDFTGGDPVVLRHGQGDTSMFE